MIHLARPSVSLILLAALGAACGETPAKPPAVPTAATQVAPVVKPSAVAGPFIPPFLDVPLPPERQTRGKLSTYSTPRPHGSMGSSSYDKIGPATVLISDGDSEGSGVIINKDGYILTNYHVVAGGKLDEHLHLTVNVQLGKLAPPDGEKESKNPDGSTNLAMRRSGDPIKAVVHLFDTVNDIAVIKIAPPAGTTLPFLTFAKTDAPIGSTIQCMGHPGIGGLWTLREGKVETVRDDVEMLTRALGDKDKDTIEQVRRYQAANGSGRLLQVSCPFVHGESGGPEVNSDGEIIGINRRFDADNSGFTRFGVPLSAIRRLLAADPSNPIDVVPDAWRDGGQIARLSDASLDGVMETLEVSGFAFAQGRLQASSHAFIVDVGQKSFAAAPPELAELRDKRTLKSRFSFVTEEISHRKYASYDVDGDGKTDVVLVEDGDDVKGFRYENGGVKADASVGENLFNPQLFPNAEERERFEAVLSTLRVSRKPASAPLDPIRGGGLPAELIDNDGDGKAERLLSKGPYSWSIAVDAPETFLEKFKIGKVDAKDVSLEGAKFDLAVVSAIGGTRTWAYSATKNAGALDLRMRVSTFPASTVETVEMLDGSAAPKDAVGRKVARPGLVTAAAWARVKLGWPQAFVAADDGLSSFPSVEEDVRTVEPFPKQGFEKKILMAGGSWTRAAFIDVDGETWKAKKDDVTLGDLGKKGQIHAKFVFLTRAGHAWAFYDTDGDGKHDVVLYAASSDSVKSDVAYRIDKAGKVTVDAALAAGALIRPAIFKGGAAGQMKQLLVSSKVFESGAAPE